MYHSFLIHSSADGHLGCFHDLAIINSAVMNIVVHVSQTLKSPLDSKEIQPVNPKGNQSLIFIGRTDAEAETPVLWPSDVKS